MAACVSDRNTGGETKNGNGMRLPRLAVTPTAAPALPRRDCPPPRFVLLLPSSPTHQFLAPCRPSPLAHVLHPHSPPQDDVRPGYLSPAPKRGDTAAQHPHQPRPIRYPCVHPGACSTILPWSALLLCQCLLRRLARPGRIDLAVGKASPDTKSPSSDDTSR